ncbi:MAG TPA: 30S ribosomal protein S15 [Candidatus Methanoperedenaceae archaeon]|nr:30S ribosomal protein S15 [Candidatus Methanoperedenaceae archaeon]
MARMHTRRKGKSGSKKPYRSEPPKWSNVNQDEITGKIVELSEQGKSTSEIGLTMRDQFGVPDVSMATGKKIGDILKEKGIEPKPPEDIRNLIKRALGLHSHLRTNPKDMHNKRALNNLESKIRRLEKYYHREGVLPLDWRYSIETAEILISR